MEQPVDGCFKVSKTRVAAKPRGVLLTNVYMTRRKGRPWLRSTPD